MGIRAQLEKPIDVIARAGEQIVAGRDLPGGLHVNIDISKEVISQAAQ
jgi:hypothetical protein